MQQKKYDANNKLIDQIINEKGENKKLDLIDRMKIIIQYIFLLQDMLLNCFQSLIILNIFVFKKLNALNAYYVGKKLKKL